MQAQHLEGIGAGKCWKKFANAFTLDAGGALVIYFNVSFLFV